VFLQYTRPFRIRFLSFFLSPIAHSDRDCNNDRHVTQTDRGLEFKNSDGFDAEIQLCPVLLHACKWCAKCRCCSAPFWLQWYSNHLPLSPCPCPSTRVLPLLHHYFPNAQVVCSSRLRLSTNFRMIQSGILPRY